MPAKLDVLLEGVLRKVRPSPVDRRMMEGLAEEFRRRTQKVIEKIRVDGQASLQGSVARDTWLREEADLDIFIQFKPDVERTVWTETLFPSVRHEFREYRAVERYAEHPFLELLDNHKLRVNIVPCYAVEKGEWISATDRTPFHTEYMKSKLTPSLTDQVRLLKRFAKGVGVYGAEVKTGGFSGMLAETLTVYHETFTRLLEKASAWKPGTIVDLEKMYEGKTKEALERFQTPLVVVDPVDPKRNLAAALRPERLWEFVAASREFLLQPDRRFFFPIPRKPETSGRLRGNLSDHGYDIVGLWFKHSRLVPDVLWGQLYRLERALAGLLERHEFRVVRSKAWSDEDEQSVLLYELESAVLPDSQLRQGPPLHRTDESRMFLERHLRAKDTVSGPWLEGDRWMIMKRRGMTSVEQLFKASLSGDVRNLSLPTELGQGLRRTGKVLLNEKIVSLNLGPSFNIALREFLDGRPGWLLRSGKKLASSR